MHHLYQEVSSLSRAQDIPVGRVQGAHTLHYYVTIQDHAGSVCAAGLAVMWSRLAHG